MEDLPVGGGSSKAGMPQDEFASTASQQVDNSGPIEDRLASKNWSQRAQAFDELACLFKGAHSAQDQVFKDHCTNWKKYLADTNPGSLEKCLDSLQAFIDIGDPKVVLVGQNDIIKNLIERCIGHAKPTIKQKGLECFNLLFEVTESFDDSVETMIECLNAKNIKVSQASQITLNSWLSNFGAKKIKLKPFMKIVETNANSSNPQIRSEAMNFYKECYKWLKEGLKPLIADLKKQQLDDLDKAFEEIKDKPKNIRYTRTEKKQMKNSQLDALIQKEEDDKMAANAAYELAEAAEILNKYNAEWQDKVLEMKKWTEKKEQLELLITDTNVPKLKNGDFSGLVKVLRKLITDSNQVVSQLAIKACGNLAKALREDFGEANCKELASTLIKKFMEKKTQIIEEVHVVLESFFNCTSMEAIASDIAAGISDKAPTVKKNVCAYLEKLAQVTYIDVLQRCSNELILALMKSSEDMAGDVRDAALSCIGIFKGRLGESSMSKYLSDLNPQKLAKVNESANKVEPSKYDRPLPKKAAPPPMAKALPAKKQVEPKKEEQKKAKMEVIKKTVKQEEADDQPMNDYDEQPIGGGQQNHYDADDIPLNIGKSNNNMPSEYDEQPISGNKGGFDEQPIGGNKGGFGEQPLGAKGGYNLDDLEEQEKLMNFGNDKPKAKAPARLAQKAKPKEQDEEKKEEEKKVIKKEIVKKVVKQEEVEDQPMNDYDDQPIGGNKGGFDEQPIGGNRGGFDEQPIGGNKGGFGEQPLGAKGGYNLDDLEEQEKLMSMGNDKPKAKVPARLAQKPKPKDEEEEKKEDDFGNNEDVIMSPTNKKPPQPKPKLAAAKEGAAKTAVKDTAKTAGGKPGALQVQEEDIGAGLSKEEAEAKVQETFSPESVALMEEAKWQDKVEGFKSIGEQIIELQPTQDVIEGLAKYVKMKMKDWKESNVNLVKETIALFTVVAQNCEKINKRAVSCLMPFLSEKIGDVKVMQSVHELLMSLAEQVTPKFVALQCIKYASNAKSPNVLKESCNILTNMTDDFGVNQMPIKEMIAYGILGINHQNPAVRTASMALFAMLFKHGGEMIKNFLKDIKESTMKLLEEEFAKVTPLKKGEYKAKRHIKGMAAEELQAQGGGAAKKGGGGGGFDDMPREDISKHLTPKFIANIKNNDWKIRKQSAEKVEEFLKAANMRIQPVGLGELMDNIKQRMVDPNKAVLKAYIQMLITLVEALGAGAKQFAKKVLPAVLACLADKSSLVRADANLCADKWAEHIGADSVINHMAPLLVQENPELRQEALTWIIKNNDAIKTTDLKELPKPLVSCLLDKVPQIRQMTEQIVGEVMIFTGYMAFQAVTKDLKPAVQIQIKPVLEKIKNKVGANNAGQDTNNGSLGQSQVQEKQQRPGTAAPQSSTNNQLTSSIKDEGQENNNNNSSLRGSNSKATFGKGAPTGTTSGVNTNTNKNDDGVSKNTFGEALKKKQIQAPAPNKLTRDQSKEPGKAKSGGGLGDSLRAFQDQSQQNQEQLTINQGYKEKRAEMDRKTKWQTEEVKGEPIEKLKVQTSQSMGQAMSAKMFSNDFKLHNECIDLFQSLIQNDPQQVTEILDIIFKWAQVKLGDSSNMQFAIKVFDFLAVLFKCLEDQQYCLQDFEACVLLPLLCERSGLNNNILKDKVKKLIRMVYLIYDRRKVYNGLISYGLNSKNQRAQAECLDEIEEFIKESGTNCTSEKELKFIAKMADSPDKNVRENAVKLLAEVYKLLDNDIWRIIGDVTPKVQGLLEGRFKKVKVTGMGMAQSNSSSNLFQPENQIGSQQDRSSPRGTSKVAQATSGIKKQNSIMENAKKSITPRNGLAFSKGDKPPSFGQQVKEQQSQMNQSTNNLSRSINKFNASNRSDEEQKKLSSNVPPNQQQQQQTSFASKAQQLKKFQSQDGADIGGLASKKLIPQTQRVDPTNSEFNQPNRLSGAVLDPNLQQPHLNRQQTSGGVLQKQKTGMNDFINGDDDEIDELRFLINDGFEVNAELDKQTEEITKHIYQLKHGDLSKRVDSLVSLNEMITQIESNKSALVRTSNDLINAFTHVLMDIFERPVEEIPLRFAKYFITIVLKACSCKEIMREASEESIFELAEQLLTRLLIEGLDKVGENKEGELILKNLNSSMLRLLENCNHTYIFCVLFNLLRKYKDFHKMPKLPGLIIKCLLKLSKILEKLIDKLDMEKILLAIHEYLVVINHENKTQNDEMGIRIVKTVTNELVKLKRESIWEAYRVIQCHGQQDNHIYRWIQIILKSLQSQGAPTVPLNGSSNQFQGTGNAGGSGSQGVHNSSDQELRSIIEELRNSEQFEDAIPKLYSFLENNPQTDLNYHLQDCSKTFQDFVKKNLDKYKILMKEEAKNNENYLRSTNDTDNSKNNQQDVDQRNGSMSTSNKVIEYSSKLASIKQKFGNVRTGENTQTNRDQQQLLSQQEPIQPQDALSKKQFSQASASAQQTQQQPNLNNSFSDMNNRLTQRWNQINKKTNVNQGATSHMSNTMGGFGGPTGLDKASVNLNQSSGGNNGMQDENEQQNRQGASNSDLNKRLAEMKAKLQALKKR